MKARLARLPVIGVALRVQDRYRLDAGEQFAAAIAAFTFLALVPIMLLLVALLGFVGQDPETQIELATEIGRLIPGLGQALGGEDGTQGFVEGVVDNRGALAGFGIIGVALTALRPINAALTATCTVFRTAVPQGAKAKLMQVLALLGLGVIAFAAVGTSAIIGFADLPTALRLGVSLGLTFALDVLLFWAAYRVLSPGARLRGRALLPGALLAGAGWTGLKVAGSAIIANQIEDANAVYGALGGVVALILLLYLAGRLYLYGAELAAVRYERVHGAIPVRAGATTLARVDDPLPDGSYVTAAGSPPPSRPQHAPRRVATGYEAAEADAPRTDVRKVAGWLAISAGMAVVYRVLRGLDPRT